MAGVKMTFKITLNPVYCESAATTATNLFQPYFFYPSDNGHRYKVVKVKFAGTNNIYSVLDPTAASDENIIQYDTTFTLNVTNTDDANEIISNINNNKCIFSELYFGRDGEGISKKMNGFSTLSVQTTTSQNKYDGWTDSSNKFCILYKKAPIYGSNQYSVFGKNLYMGINPFVGAVADKAYTFGRFVNGFEGAIRRGARENQVISELASIGYNVSSSSDKQQVLSYNDIDDIDGIIKLKNPVTTGNQSIYTIFDNIVNPPSHSDNSQVIIEDTLNIRPNKNNKRPFIFPIVM